MPRVPVVVFVCIVSLVSVIGCDRQPSGDAASDSGVQPVPVEQVRSGPFRVERRYTGRVRALTELKVVVREPGQVVGVPAPPDSQPVRTGQKLLELRSPDLELEVEEAESMLEAARLDLERQQRLSDLGLAPLSELEWRQAAVDRARIALERLKLRQANLTVTASASGVLLHGPLPAPGQWCAAGQEVARVVDPRSLVVEVAVPAAWSEHAKSVRHAVLDLGDMGEVRAEVVSLSAEADPERGGRILTLRPPAGAQLAAEEVLALRLVVVELDEALTVPAGALSPNQEGGYRVAIGPAPGEVGRLRWVDVVPGASDGQRTVVSSGLEAGTWVVVSSEVGSLTARWESYLGVGR
jgi:RND family efflux transporter MFP subunit